MIVNIAFFQHLDTDIYCAALCVKICVQKSEVKITMDSGLEGVGQYIAIVSIMIHEQSFSQHLDINHCNQKLYNSLNLHVNPSFQISKNKTKESNKENMDQ